MEESNLQPNPQTQPHVGFPQNQPKPKSKMSLIFFVVLGIILLIGAVVFFISRSANQAVPSPSPTSFFSAPSPIPSFEPSPEPDSSPTSADKSEISIEILNGTGVAGEASYLQGQLKNLGYEKITAANASTQDETATTITFAKNVPTAIKSEIETKLKSIYSEVKVSNSSTLSGVDIRILTGPRKGASPKASATPAASSSATPTTSPQASASPSTSPSASPSQ